VLRRRLNSPGGVGTVVLTRIGDTRPVRLPGASWVNVWRMTSMWGSPLAEKWRRARRDPRQVRLFTVDPCAG